MMKHLLVAVLAAALSVTPVMVGANTDHDHGPKKSSKKAKKKPKQTQCAVICAMAVEQPVIRVADEKIGKST